MGVPITYRQKMDFGSCVQMVGFPKYGHICDLQFSLTLFLR